MKTLLLSLAAVMLLVLPACATKEKPKPRVPLPLGLAAPQQAVQATDQGSKAYQSGDFDAARASFEQAVAAMPQSGEAHYNLGLTLYAMGDNDNARDHFIQAADLAPGNKVIWDSPALRPYGSPDPNIQTKKKEYQGRAGSKGLGPGGGTSR
ncbi:MAG: hypothetical protein A4S17_01380 [Proteobacteria bacterium HN_bin10]|nr:MAG: hypothetical protein A4S17_01380 [Proteobacteria bacterium HN_bin10]